MTRLEKELAGLATMSLVQLRERWEVGGAESAPSLPTVVLRRLLAQRLQEKRHGSLPLLVARELERVAADTGSTAPPSPPQKVSLSAGTRLIREWNGQTIAVEVTDAGFVWNDRTWRSLTEIARKVTGAHWSGPRFFGLKRRG
jgi:Protein of unknown function (DUF2924)